MRRLFTWVGLIFVFLMVTNTAAQAATVVIYDDAVTNLAAASFSASSNDLWVTLTDLTRTTGFVVKPQGVCRNELCFPLPKQKKADFLVRRGPVMWFNLSEFARLIKQPVAHDERLGVWYFGPRPDVQNGYLSSLEAPNFTLPDMNGARHSLADFRGKKVLLLTWASW